MIWFTSDWHLNDNRPMIYGKDGFKSIEEMRNKISLNLKKAVNCGDTVYILGDIFNANMYDTLIPAVDELNESEIFDNLDVQLILGNHDICLDTGTYPSVYNSIHNLTVLGSAEYLLENNADTGNVYRMYLSHYPSLTDSLPSSDYQLFNIHGHTHQHDPVVYNTTYYMYDVSVYSHNWKPVPITEIEDYIDWVQSWRGDQINTYDEMRDQ